MDQLETDFLQSGARHCRSSLLQLSALLHQRAADILRDPKKYGDGAFDDAVQNSARVLAHILKINEAVKQPPPQ